MFNTGIMKKLFLLLFTILVFFTFESNAQFSRYIIRFKDKANNPFTISNPSQYLSARALLRRTNYSIPIDSVDLPITHAYIDSVRLAGTITILNASKWLNQVAIQTTDAAALAKINSFPFVISSTPVASIIQPSTIPVNKQFDAPGIFAKPELVPQNAINDFYSYGQSFGQVHLHNGEFLHNRGFRGQGMQMAVMDAGFLNYQTLPTFDSIRNNGQVLGTWDYVSRNSNVNDDHPHGTNCLSTIAAHMPGVFVGTAPKTSFYLYRTEEAATEYPIEEQNWAAAAERADSLGVDICSVSLGYYTFDNAVFNHTYADMDGNTTMIAKAADIAAKKGMLIVVAAGNEGSGSWRYIISPADADSVIAVGAVNTSGVVGGFSSYGPSSDGQVKPTLAAVGVGAIVASSSTGQPISGNGTSFACPNLAGLATCLWQAFPEVNNINIINTLQQAANRAANPDDRTGFGIPDMKKAFVMLIKQLYTQQVTVTNCTANLQWNTKSDSVITMTVERKLSTDNNYLPVFTTTGTGGFKAGSFSYSEDLSTVTGNIIKYRVKMDVAADTSFYFDSVTVNFIPKPILGADKSIIRCSDSTLNLSSLFTTTGLTTFWMLNGSPVAVPTSINTPGNYQLIAVNNSGCSDTALVTVNFIANPNSGSDKTVAKCTDSTYNLTTAFTTTGLTANWSIGGLPLINPGAVSTAGIYQLIVINTSGCSDTALVTLVNDPQQCPAIIEKITISPNPVIDNLNVVISKKNASKIEIVIIDMWGQRMYRTISQQAAGSQSYIIPLKQLSAGMYTITVWVNEKREIIKKLMKR